MSKAAWFGRAALIVALAVSAPAALAAVSDDYHKSAAEAREYIAITPDLFLLDVRPAESYEKGHLAGAENIPFTDLEKDDARLAELPAGRPVLIYCQSGIRSEKAYELIRQRRPDVGPVHVVSGAILEPESLETMPDPVVRPDSLDALGNQVQERDRVLAPPPPTGGKSVPQ